MLPRLRRRLVRAVARAVAVGCSLVAVGCSDSLVPTGGSSAAPGLDVPVEPIPPIAYSTVPKRSIVMLQDGDEPVRDVARALLAEYAPTAGARADSVVLLAASRGFVATVSEAEAVAMAGDPRVAYAENEKIAELAATPWALDRINQRALPLDAGGAAEGDGTGVQIYVLDTGTLPGHADFGGRVTPGPDFVAGSGLATADCHGHGTLVASDAAGATMGFAKKASIIGVRVMGCDGSGSTVWMIQGVDWVIAQKQAHPDTPMVINMSLGVSGGFAPVDDAVARATAAGITVVVAAGNANTNACTVSPARAPSAITVGATAINDARASFSNYGTCVDIWAPGSGVDGASAGNPNGFQSWSGTSAASPYVAGVAALYLEQYPDADPTQVAQALGATATPGKVTGTGVSNNKLVFAGLTLPSVTTPPSGGNEPTAPGPPTPAAAITCVRRACTFDARGSTDASGIAKYAWAFGDGSKSGTASVSKKFKTDGQYPVALTVTNKIGMSATRLDTVSIHDGAPVAAFSASCSGWTCTLDASASTDDGRIARHSWSYGDGRVGSSVGPTIKKVYTGVATFQVRLIVTDDVGQADTTTVAVTTQPRPPVPKAVVTCTSARLCTFDAAKSTDDLSIATVTWNFNDNTLQTGTKVTKQYSAGGSYTFRLTVKSTSGLQTNLDGKFTLR